MESGVNAYLYVDADPLTFIDPYGLWKVKGPLKGGSYSTYIYTSNGPLKHSDVTGEGFVDCVKALAELVTATAVLTGRIEDMKAKEGKPDPGNHPKAIQQAVKRVKNAIAKVARSFACVAGAAAAIGAAQAAIDAAAPYLVVAALAL